MPSRPWAPALAVPEGNEEALAAVFAAKPKLYWIGCGKKDGVMVNSRKLKDYCDAHGYPVTLYESEGGHIWRNWRVYLTLFAQQLFWETPPTVTPTVFDDSID